MGLVHSPREVSLFWVSIPPLSSLSYNIQGSLKWGTRGSFFSLCLQINWIGMSSPASKRKRCLNKYFWWKKQWKCLPKTTHSASAESLRRALSLQLHQMDKTKQQGGGGGCWIFRFRSQTVQFSAIHCNLLESAKNKIIEPQLGWGHKLQRAKTTKIEHDNSEWPVAYSGMDRRWHKEWNIHDAGHWLRLKTLAALIKITAHCICPQLQSVHLFCAMLFVSLSLSVTQTHTHTRQLHVFSDCQELSISQLLSLLVSLPSSAPTTLHLLKTPSVM